jgi:hypothetical protein
LEHRLVLPSRDGRITDRVENRGIDDAAVENAIAAAKDVLGVAGNVPCKAHTRAKVSAV